MKKLGVFLFALSMTVAAAAQDKSSFSSRLAQKNILNHMDLGVNVGTLGIGIDVAVPVGDYVRVRAGYNYMPQFTMHSDFDIKTRSGKHFKDIIENSSFFEKYINFVDNKDNITREDILNKLEQKGINTTKESVKNFVDATYNINLNELPDHVTMGMSPSLHQFNFLVDVMPFKNNKHWSFTGGFFAGSSIVMQLINAYNDFYVDYGKGTIWNDDKANYIKDIDDNGIAGFPLGEFSKDIMSKEGITLARKGDKAIMVPGSDGTARAKMEVSKIRPYLGVGYNTHLSKDKKWNLNVDAGVLFLCGAPKVFVDNVYSIDKDLKISSGENYDIIHLIDIDPETGEEIWITDEPLQHVDLVHDLTNISGKVGDMVNTISKFKVYPNLSVTFSYKLF